MWLKKYGFQKKIISLIFPLTVLNVPFQVYADTQRTKTPVGGFQVQVLKTNQKHLKTAALICALYLENETKGNQIEKAWAKYLKVPISPDDRFLVIHVMQRMCPGITQK